MEKTAVGDEQEITPELEQTAEKPEVETKEPEATEVATPEEELVVTIGEAPPPEEDEKSPELVRTLRQRIKEQNRELSEYRKRVPVAEKAPELGKKPTLEDCDFDADKFETELIAWQDRKRAVEEQARKASEAAENEQKAWQQKLEGYAQSKAALKVKDFEDAESVVLETLSQIQQGVIVKASKNPGLLVYALGKNPGKAKELASLHDPIDFAFAVGQLEKDLKMTSRKPETKPEPKVTGTASVSGTDTKLAALEAEADRTGDRTKVIAYKRQLKAAKS